MKFIIAFAALLSVAAAIPAYGPAITTYAAAPIITKSYAAPIAIAAPAAVTYSTRTYAAAPIISKSYVAAPAITYSAPLITKSYAAPLYGSSLLLGGGYGHGLGYGKYY